MSNFAHSNDCLNYIYLRSGDNANAPQFAANALLHLNVAHRELVSGTCKLIPEVTVAFPWAKAAQPKTLTIVPSETGTCAITQNSASIVFGSAPAASKVGYHIKFGTDETTYRIDSHTAAASAATLDSAVVASTNATSSYTLFKIDYTIGSSDVLRILDLFNSAIDPSLGSESFQLIGEEESMFRRYFPTFSSGRPTHFTLLYESEGTLTIRLNKYLSTTQYQRLDAPYIPLPSDLTASDLSIPLVPRQHRPTLCEHALHLLHADKGDDRAAATYEIATKGYVAMLKEVGVKDITFKPFRTNEQVKLGG